MILAESRKDSNFLFLGYNYEKEHHTLVDGASDHQCVWYIGATGFDIPDV